MTYQAVYLSSSAVNSGNEVKLSAREITFKHNNNLRSPSKPGYFTTSDAIGEVDFISWENPTINIQGVFDEKNAPSNSATVSLLKEFAKETTSVYFKDNLLFTTYQKIQISDLTLSRNAQDNISESGSDKWKGTIINYTINAILTE